jgi:catechol 2,3-dioxygenase-like lactoylglutathione lyase family enzyme
MFSHLCIGVTDFERALSFYGTLFEALGIEQRFCERDKPWAGWLSAGGQRPLFVIATPLDGAPHAPGNGQMTAFSANSRGQVDEVHRLALSLGAQDEGAPGRRPHYHADYYGAYFRDLDGNKLCVVCHSPETP